ncbi:MAG TPA: MBL fold metallo-hydrolase, partial [Steroidobacteraceae bacterium]|nr:MBL fold metallo-hydrolase [Steroidobacteraceae bacterium]
MRPMPSAISPLPARAALTLAGVLLLLMFAVAHESTANTEQRKATDSHLPQIAPIGVPIRQHLQIPEHAKGPPVDAVKGYRLEDFGGGLYMITDNVYQSMILVYETGVVVADAPPSYATHLVEGIREVTDKPITHLIYSHSHVDHIGGATALGPVATIIAHEETKRLLARANDSKRPLPTVTFTDRYTLNVGTKTLQLSYHGVAHEPGNIFIYAPEQQVLMVIDVVFPGWMPWRRFALAQDVPGYFAQVETIKNVPFKTLIAGHVARAGTHADVELQYQFLRELKVAAGKALAATKAGAGLTPESLSNPWAVF